MKILEVVGSSGSSKSLVVNLKNLPNQEDKRLLVEAAYLEEAGKQKNWGNGYSYRLDKRGEHHGGNQLHIFKGNDAWAYRFNGARSEPTKYTTPSTNTVQNMVRDIFNLGPDVKIESHVISASAEQLLLEIHFL